MTDVQNATRPLFVYTIPSQLAAKTKVSQVGLVEITPDEELMASRRARNDAIRLSQELAKESLRMVNGQKVTSVDGSVDTAWNQLPAKIRQLVMAAYTELHNPDMGDSADFLKSRQTEV